jgi:hypothetical protein
MFTTTQDSPRSEVTQDNISRARTIYVCSLPDIGNQLPPGSNYIFPLYSVMVFIVLHVFEFAKEICAVLRKINGRLKK